MAAEGVEKPLLILPRRESKSSNQQVANDLSGLSCLALQEVAPAVQTVLEVQRNPFAIEHGHLRRSRHAIQFPS